MRKQDVKSRIGKKLKLIIYKSLFQNSNILVGTPADISINIISEKQLQYRFKICVSQRLLARIFKF